MEKEIQDIFIKRLQRKRIDFIRVKNQGFKGKAKSANSFGVWKDGEPNDKFFPDIMFPFEGTLFMIEFAIGNTNPKRKEKQRERGLHWEQQIKSEYHVIKSKDQVISFFMNKIEPKQTQDDIDQMTIKDYL